MPTEAPRRMGRDQRRASLLAAATELLRRPGSPLTFESIAAEAGVSATLPYKYFASIDEVALELYAEFVHEIDAATDALLADPGADFDGKVRGAMDLWFDAVGRDGALFVRLTGPDAPTGLRRFVRERRARVADLWAREVASEFGLAADDADLVAVALVAATSAVLQRTRVERLDRDHVTATTVAMVRGMGAAAADTLAT